MHRKGFTLIELLIVIAIIAILALIAIPNFLEAQTRAKISRAQTDMRTIATALETYLVDHNSYLFCSGFHYALWTSTNASTQHKTFERLTTPVAYLTGGKVFEDPFGYPASARYTSVAGTSTWVRSAPNPITNDSELLATKCYYYAVTNEGGYTANWENTYGNLPRTWFLQCKGPDQAYYSMGTIVRYLINPNSSVTAQQADANAAACVYDPSNGTISIGSIWRVGGMSCEYTGRAFAVMSRMQK